MTPEELSELRAAMYEQPDDIEELETNSIAPSGSGDVEKPFSIEMAGKYVNITVDNQRLAIPSVSYVTSLERQLTEQSREILRLKASVKQMRALINQHSGELNDVNRELDRKINLRDM